MITSKGLAKRKNHMNNILKHTNKNYSPCRLALIIFTLFLTLSSWAADVKEFGAKGDGKTDDTEAILKAIQNSVNGQIEFPKGEYKITRTIEIRLSEHGTLSVSGNGGTGKILMAGEGPAFRFIGSHDKGSALPSTVKPITWEKERMPMVSDLEILGLNEKADGLEFRNTMQPTIRGVLIRNVRNGIHLTSRNRNIIIDNCHIYNASGIGVFLDDVDIHQFIISDSHISYCKKGGIKVSGSSIRNFQITGNDIEYNCDPEGVVSADILIDCSQEGSSVREGTISGNTIQAIYSPGGANIRFIGSASNANKIGLWSITGNHIGNQDFNIDLVQSRGISIIGNTFMRGYDRNIVVKNSKNIIMSDNIIDRNEDYYLKPSKSGGVMIEHGQNIIFNNNIVEGSEAGDEQVGGSVLVRESKYISLNNNQIKDARYHGIQVIDSKGIMVTDCIITEDLKQPRMISGIALQGECAETVVRGNTIRTGTKAAIDNNAKSVLLESNIITTN